MITVKINDEGGQLFIVIKGARATVGKVRATYKPHHIGIRCTHTEKPVVRSFLTSLHENGYWVDSVKEKTTPAVSIRLSEVRRVLGELQSRRKS